MKKLFVLIIMPFILYPAGKNWYVSNTSAGNASGDSWNNKKILSGFDWAKVMPGDTVFIDGGKDSLIYNHCISISPGKLSGTVDKKIVITKGRDRGYNGKAIIGGNSSSLNGAALFAYSINYTEWSHLTFKGADQNRLSSTIVTIGITNSTGVDILHCDIRNDASDAIVLVRTNNVRVLYCNIYNEKNCLWATDAFHLNGGSNLEIGYSTISSNNPQTGGTILGHRDFLHTEGGYGLSGGIVKIHHNFFNDKSNSNNAMGMIYASDIGGEWQLYNNIFKMTSEDGDMIGIYDYNNKSNIKIYNNTLYATKSSVNPFAVYGFDSLDVQNNIFYLPANWIAVMLDRTGELYGHANYDYNQYYVKDSSRFAYMWENWSGDNPPNSSKIGWAAWRSKGFDINSEYNETNFANIGGNKPEDYKLIPGSNGIDKGNQLLLFSDDKEGNPRPQGKSWDRGAFEYLESKLGDDPADTSGLVSRKIKNGKSRHWYGDYTPDKSIDGKTKTDPASRWGGAIPMPDTITYELEEVVSISQTRISFFNWEGGRKYKYKINTSKDGFEWVTSIPEAWSEPIEWTVNNFTQITAKYVQVISLENNQSVFAGIWEIEIWGKDNSVNEVEEESDLDFEPPQSFELYQNYPNPFNPSTTILVNLPKNMYIKLSVYNTLGELVSILADNELSTGKHQFNFDGSGLASGIYFYRIDSPEFVETKKMVLLR